MKPNREDARTWPGCGHARNPDGRERECLRCKRYQAPLFPSDAADDVELCGTRSWFPAHAPSNAASCAQPSPAPGRGSPGLAKGRPDNVVSITRARHWRQLGSPMVAGSFADLDVFRAPLPGGRQVELLIPRELDARTRDNIVSALRVFALWLEVES